MSMVTRPPREGVAGRRGEQVGEVGLERAFALGVGVALIVLGLLGSFGNPLVGRPGATSLIVTGPGHDIVHLVVGALFVHVGHILSARQRSTGLLALGAFLALSGFLSLVVPDLLGVYGLATSGLDQLAHLALGITAVVIGWLGRGATGRRPAARSARMRGARRTGA
ncbi:hypothetical protein BH23CHL8_BH23CHL8_10850 [soil metagenome]